MQLTPIALCYLATVNLVAAYMFWLDWRYEKHRIGVGVIPERTFLFLSLIGGAFGILLLQGALKHRTYRKHARRKYLMAMAVQLVVAGLPLSTLASMLPH